MIGPHKAFRMAVFQALNGNLTDPDSSSPIMIFDEKAEDNTSNFYVLLTTETGARIPNFNLFLHDSTLLIQIIDKQQDTVSKDFIDDLGTQITQILFPGPASDGLVQQSGFHINCLIDESINSNDAAITAARTEIKKLIRLSAKVCELT